MNSLQHIAISASAGSGKTYQLTNRFIYLLHLAEQPERIIALTFTRTAAGEFFHKIIEKLSDAASDPQTAAQLSAELQIDADAARYHHLLRILISRMHQLNLQTLDSFFFRVVSAFALELGLSGSLNLLDETSEPRLRNEVRDSIVHRPGELNEELHEFWQAFKQATYGHDARKVESIVSDFIEQLYNLYLDAPQATLWGEAARIWPQGCPWTCAQAPDWDQLANSLRAAVPEDFMKSQKNDFESAATKVQNYPVKEELNTLLNNAFAVARDILAGQAILKVRKEIDLPAPLCTALADILKAIVWHHLQRALQNTQGVYRILEAYHQNYDRLVRRPGRLAFADLTHLLSPETLGSPMGVGDSNARELMDFRLDGQFDHWLFDEFQDTSRPQWAVVRNLIDEILQDASGQRSLFYVGDTKQCLYLWRNSDDRLFHDIRAQYTNIIDQQLAESWRSAPAILDAVNASFQDNALIAETFSPDAAQRWANAWKPHTASKATAALSGYACWLEAKKNDSPTRNERILEILTQLNPIERGMSVGVLVRRNKDANEVADYLRENSAFPVHTGSAVKPAEDNAAGAALLAMLRHAAHPSDQLAAGFLQLIDASTGADSLLAATNELRTRLLRDNHESAVRWACQRILTKLTAQDTRHRTRLNQLIEKARAFDSEDSRDLDALYRYLQNSSSGDCAPGDAVIVETIHKSKGLEYDIVILVNEDKGGGPGDRRISALLDSQGKAQWILEPIKKDLMTADPELSRLQAQSESQQDFGNLCTLYVGMTRAKRALYMISDFSRVSKRSSVHYLRQCLGDEADSEGLIWATGDPDWHQSFKAKARKSTPPELPPIHPKFEPAHPRLQLQRPSSDKHTRLKASTLFDYQANAAEFGTQVHDAFEQIAWLEATSPMDPLLHECFANPDIQALFTQPTQAVELWREKAFSYVEGEQFINGVFDRVHIYKDASGKITQAEIIDYKTDRIREGTTITQAAEKHRPQLQAYAKALGKITGLTKEQIQLTLIFTHTSQLQQL
ncbi:UvrD-helicase domain-containing protein [Coraliomargarita sp. SDUM461004]|uniref:DNA 3'-5' helicase n=1 Tax=Thalassobacterium sedimentorum TaxID=3041258 RepID=A0ABU1AMB5_9BACT|nr:UvrD-helicase domain-containing protein [Coraliomargarita sp. SDUM461004]MDQ8195947.1 UvrD-helicase domain-containing protein [Coraliomargarita sp. SDUM461004]